jgi:hypothetical protein
MEKRLAIMQPYIFPYLGYYQLIHCVDKFIFYDDVNFIKNGWINRNNILVNGQKHLFSIPLKAQSSYKKILEIEIDKSKKWSEKLLNTIYISYKKAVHFDEIYKLIEPIFSNNNYSSISEISKESVVQICEYLDIETELVVSSELYNNAHLSGSERIIDLCLNENANCYVNPIGGKVLYSKTNFASNNIELSFLVPSLRDYNQFVPNFLPGLSIIDVLMFNSKLHIKEMLNQYELV